MNFEELNKLVRELTPEQQEEMSKALIKRMKIRAKEFDEQSRINSNFDYNRRYTI